MKHLLLLLVVTLFSSAPVAMAAWTGQAADQQISFDDNEYANTAKIRVDPDNILHVIWHEDNPTYDDVMYGNSLDGGATWSSTSGDFVINIPDVDYVVSNAIDFIIDGNGVIYVVWSEAAPTINEIWLTKSTDGGATWSGTSDTIFVSDINSTDNANYPAIAVDGNNVVHCVWNQTNPAQGIAEIYYSRSYDNGNTWSPETFISFPDSNAAAFADIACDVWGNVYVIWREATGTDSAQVHYVVSHDGGTTWNNSQDNVIGYPMKFVLDPKLAIDPVGNLHSIWRGSMDAISPYHYEIYYSGSMDNGLIWSGLDNYHRISFWQTDGNSAHNQEVACDRWGNIFAFWNEEQLGAFTEIHLSVSTDNGILWSGETVDEIISFPDGENGYRPMGSGDSNGNMHVVWTEFNGSSPDNYEVHYSKGDPYGYTNFAQLGLYAIDAPISIPAGGSFKFSIAEVNNTEFGGAANGWIDLRLPDSTVYSPLILAAFYLGPGQTIAYDSVQINVPSIAPVGQYTFYARTGSYPNTVYAQDSFTFAVTAATAGGNGQWEVFGFGDRENESSLSGISQKIDISAYPNPFNAQTSFSYSLAKAGDVKLEIYNLMGQKVATVIDERQEAGQHSINWDATNFSSGIYFYKLTAGDNIFTKRMTLLK